MSAIDEKGGVSVVMPISGIKFVNQVWLLTQVIRCGGKVSRILSTSGGTITAMMALASDLASVCDEKTYAIFLGKLKFILGELDAEWYCKPRCSVWIINTLMSLGKESCFERGNGEELIRQYNLSSKDQPEVWMGTQNYDTMAHQVWCTKSRDEASVDMGGVNYLDDDTETITKVAIGSCAVPMFVPSIQIGKHSYRDGGMKFASPLGDCLPMFRTSVTNGPLPYKLVYISPVRYNLNENHLSDELEDDDIWRQMQGSIAGMVTDIHLADMNNSVRVLGKECERKTVFGYNSKALMIALELQKTVRASVIRISPVDAVYVSFISMPKGRALEAFEEVCGTSFHVRHDYVE